MKTSIRTIGTAVACAALFAAGAASAQSAPVGPSNLGAISGPYTTSYGDTFSSPQALAVGSSLYSFTDAYTFSIPNAALDSFTATINLGTILNIANFQAALFNGTPLAAQFGGTGAGSHIGFAGSTSGAVSGLAWNSGNGSFITLSSPHLAAGSYTLEVRGWANGSNGGSYAGVLNVSPVPEASTLMLMLAGMGLLAAAALSRKPD